VLGKARLVRCFLSAIAALSLTLFPLPSSAHPMGNFSISHYAGIRVEQGFVELRYLVDMAEIPTFQEIQKSNIVAQTNDPRVLGYLLKQAEVLKEGLLLTLNGQPLPLRIASQDIVFSPGAGNLPTMKLGLVYRAEVTDVCAVTRCELEYHDTNFSGRVGRKSSLRPAPV
jgi:nickel/cobalt exporter